MKDNITTKTFRLSNNIKKFISNNLYGEMYENIFYLIIIVTFVSNRSFQSVHFTSKIRINGEYYFDENEIQYKYFDRMKT